MTDEISTSRIWDKKLGAMLSPYASRYFESTKKILDSRISLLDRFIVVAETLSPSTAQVDIDKFTQMKKARDAFFHEPDVVPPGSELRDFVARYLGMYLGQDAQGGA